MPQITGNVLQIEQCPRCGVVNPATVQIHVYAEAHAIQRGAFQWFTFACRACGGPIVVQTLNGNLGILGIDPKPRPDEAAVELPERARAYLREAVRAARGGAPTASVMACASSVDAMLKAKEYREGTLYTRIGKAADDRVITPEMAKWAHQVRLEANDQRHADENAPLPTKEDAERCIEFAETLGELLFVLPAKVTRGIGSPTPSTPEAVGGQR